MMTIFGWNIPLRQVVFKIKCWTSTHICDSWVPAFFWQYAVLRIDIYVLDITFTKKVGLSRDFPGKSNWEKKKSGKQDTLMSEVICPHLRLLRVRQEMRWLYHCCHFVFGWLGSFLSWIGFADDGAGEPRREIHHLSRRAPLFNMQHLCRGERSKMAAPWRMTVESAQNLGRGRL